MRCVLGDLMCVKRCVPSTRSRSAEPKNRRRWHFLLVSRFRFGKTHMNGERVVAVAKRNAAVRRFFSFRCETSSQSTSCRSVFVAKGGKKRRRERRNRHHEHNICAARNASAKHSNIWANFYLELRERVEPADQRPASLVFN